MDEKEKLIIALLATVVVGGAINYLITRYRSLHPVSAMKKKHHEFKSRSDLWV